jgi:hypothetical protein
VIGNLSLVEFSGGFSFSSSYSLVILASWVGCFLLDILLGLSLFSYNRVYISSCCSVLTFLFLYIENTKIIHFALWHLIFGFLSLILIHVWKYCILFEIAELNWKLHFLKACCLLRIEVKTLHYIHIHFFYLLSHNIISFTTTSFE